MYGLKRANMDRINLLDEGAAHNTWKISCNGGLGHSIYTGSFTTPGSLGTYYRCEFPGPTYKWGTLWVGRGTHDDSSWRGAFAFKIMYHGAGWGHFNSGEWRVLGYDNDTRLGLLKQEIVIIITDYIFGYREDLHISGAVMVCIIIQ